MVQLIPLLLILLATSLSTLPSIAPKSLRIPHYSAEGVAQYASVEYIDELKHHGFEVSMARMGNPYENTMMGSFFKTLKYEEVYLCDYETMADVIERLPYFIEEVYNQKRLQSVLGYL